MTSEAAAGLQGNPGKWRILGFILEDEWQIRGQIWGHLGLKEEGKEKRESVKITRGREIEEKLVAFPNRCVHSPD